MSKHRLDPYNLVNYVTMDYCRAKKAVRRLGYMGHLVRISNSLVKFGEVDEQVR